MKIITTFAYYKLLFAVSFGLIILLLIGIGQYNTLAAIAKTEAASNITLYYISTREPENFNTVIPLNPEYKSKVEPGYGNDKYLNFSQLIEQPCKKENVTIFVHGWEESEKNVQERLNRVKLSLAMNNYTGPLIGFSWPSDTVWLGAQFIAKANGPKLAHLISDIKNDCPRAEIRIIAHSLGARVVLSSLDSLLKNQTWNDRNFTIASVHLMGAAVDDEEVSTRPEFILIDQTNWGTAKFGYGQAIQKEVIKFSNLFSSNDNMLEQNTTPPTLKIYPTFESDSALGQTGYQKSQILPIYDINKTKALPTNYNEINVTDELIAKCDADGDKQTDLPFYTGNNITRGDNHRGYLGYRNVTNNSTIIDDGAIDVVLDSWNNNKPTVNINPNFNSSSICPDSFKSIVSPPS